MSKSNSESLTAALDPWFGKSLWKLPDNLQARVWHWLPQLQDTSYRLPPRRFVSLWDRLGPSQQREAAKQQDWQCNPAFDHEAEFWLEVPFRKPKLEAMRVQAQNIDAPDAIALAVRNAMLFHIDEAIDALPKDEEEVRSALLTELKATIEKVRRHWKERDKRAADLGLEVFSLALAAKDLRSAGEARPDVRAWDAVWRSEHPFASDDDEILAAKKKFGDKNVSERQIIALRKPADGSRRKTGPKIGKLYARQRRITALPRGNELIDKGIASDI